MGRFHAGNRTRNIRLSEAYGLTISHMETPTYAQLAAFARCEGTGYITLSRFASLAVCSWDDSELPIRVCKFTFAGDLIE